jgi:hypothetical protein
MLGRFVNILDHNISGKIADAAEAEAFERVTAALEGASQTIAIALQAFDETFSPPEVEETEMFPPWLEGDDEARTLSEWSKLLSRGGD